MDFSDKSGHIFSLPHYNTKPIGYEYKEQDYVFYISSDRTSRLSIKNYYGDVIYALYRLPKNMNSDEINYKYEIEIVLESNVFKLISSKKIQELVNSNNDINDYIPLVTKDNYYKIYNDEIHSGRTELSSKNDDDLEVMLIHETLENGSEVHYLLIPIYVICSCDEEGTFLSNILIHINDTYDFEETWCPITIGATFIDEYEALMINGRNMGIDLPRDIIKAIYSVSYQNEVFDEALYNVKMKEYLYNYMNIRGEKGNFASAIDSLKWFGWGDKISISKLIATDNEMKAQYIKDFFDISYDIIEAYKFFRNSANISLSLALNKETENNYEQDLSSSGGSGEGHPILEDLTSKTLVNEIWLDNERWGYIKPYYNFSLNELGLKLICLKYYYQKYFLPIHLQIHTLSMIHKVYANNIKFMNKPLEFINEVVVNVYDTIGDEASCIIGNGDIFAEDDKHIHYFTKQIHFVDENFNEFDIPFDKLETYLKDESEDNTLYYINDTCAYVPIHFSEGVHTINFILYDITQERTIYEYNDNFIITKNEETEETSYKNFVIHPKSLMNLSKDVTLVNWLFDDFIIYINDNNTWYSYKFNFSINEMHIEAGKLYYEYNELFKQVDYDKLINGELVFNSYMHEPGLVTVNSNEFWNRKSPLSVYEYIDNLYNKNYIYVTPSDIQPQIEISKYDETILNKLSNILFNDDVDPLYLPDSESIIIYNTKRENSNKVYTLIKIPSQDEDQPNVYRIEKHILDISISDLKSKDIVGQYAYTPRLGSTYYNFRLLMHDYEKAYEHVYGSMFNGINNKSPLNIIELYEIYKKESFDRNNILYLEPNRTMTFNGFMFETPSVVKSIVEDIKTKGSPILISYDNNIEAKYMFEDPVVDRDTNNLFIASSNPEIYGNDFISYEDIKDREASNTNDEEIAVHIDDSNISYVLNDKYDNPAALWYNYQIDVKGKYLSNFLFNNEIVKLFNEYSKSSYDENNNLIDASYAYRGYRNFILEDLSVLTYGTYKIGVHIDDNFDDFKNCIGVGIVYENTQEVILSDSYDDDKQDIYLMFERNEENDPQDCGHIYMFLYINDERAGLTLFDSKQVVYMFIKDTSELFEPQKYTGYDESVLNDNIFEITYKNKNNEDVTQKFNFGDNTSNEVVSLYTELAPLFENPIYDEETSTLTYNQYAKETINIAGKDHEILMDNYIMHDDKSWYLVRISKYPINVKVYENDELVNDPILLAYNNSNMNKWMKEFLKSTDTTLELTVTEPGSTKPLNMYEFRRKNAVLKLLPNRLKYERNEDNKNYYSIKDNDLIIARIFNNDKLGFNPVASPKWTISGKSYTNLYIKNKKLGNTDAICFTASAVNNQIGYYDISVNYSLDYAPVNIKENRKTSIKILK